MDDARDGARRRLAARRGLDDRRGRRRPRAGGGQPDRPPWRRRHSRARQHPPPPLPDPDARACPAGRPVHLAPRAVSGVVADRRRGGVRRGAHRAGRARALRLHDGFRPPLRLPAWARRPDRGRGPGGTRARCADRGLARVDGSRRLGGRPAARRARRGHRRRPRGHRAPRRCAARARARRPASSWPSPRAPRSRSAAG